MLGKCRVEASAHAQSLSRIRLFATPWTVARHAPLSMGFPRQAYWSGLPFPPPADLPNPGIEPASPALAGRFFNTWDFFGRNDAKAETPVLWPPHAKS